jgi:C-terminal processing protease CtpA/Prc
MTTSEARAAINKRLGSRVPLASFRPTITPLDRDERQMLVDQAQMMLENVYAHLPLKRAIYGIDPIQRLRLLGLHQQLLDERAFQSALIEIFVSLRDLHTNYVLPREYGQKYAFLPFRIEEFYEANHRKYLVSWVSPISKDRKLRAGMVATHWNGSPIELAVMRNAEREAGSNPEARRARGVDALCLRWFGASLPPDEDWVVLTYTDAKRIYESRHDWEVVDAEDLGEVLPGLGATGGGPLIKTGWGIDVQTELLRRLRKAVFDARALRAEAEMAALRVAAPAKAVARGAGALAATAAPKGYVSNYPEIFPRFGPVSTPSGKFGYIQLKTFVPPPAPPPLYYDVDAAIYEFIRMLEKLPPTGLILDVRGNGGGIIAFGERILQLLTPRLIEPEPFHFLSTSMTLAIARSEDWLNEWRDPIAQGIETGSSYSQGFPLTPRAECNGIGQVYQGPTVLITDALCYSTTDIFAAGFQDHQIGTIVGVHSNTGAGGANVWDHKEVLVDEVTLKPNPFRPLPRQARMRVAARRSTRVGKRSGAPLEDLGVVPNEVYHMTRDDLVKHNVDLIAYAAKILSKKQTHLLRLEAIGPSPVKQIRIESRNIDRVDVMIESRPVLSHDVADGKSKVRLPVPVQTGTTLKAYGYRAGVLVASARTLIN